MTQKINEIKNKTHRIIDRNSVPREPATVNGDNTHELENSTAAEPIELTQTSRRDMLKAILPSLGKVATKAARSLSVKVHESIEKIQKN